MNSTQPTSETNRRVFTLFELTQSLESVINKAYQRPYWIRAEIAKLNYYPKSGHCYPDLVEKKDGKTLAQIRSTIWAGTYTQIKTKFIEVTRENLNDGMNVLMLASIHFHPVHGLTLQITDIDPSFTLGEMARERFESVARLKKEGIFDQNRNVPFPILPQRVAIISVETSKGYQDFIKTINNNALPFTFFSMLFPALLQGIGAITSIKQQLERIQKVKHHFDVVVVIRGGGGDVGLSSFDNYTLASSVARFPLPVITGIGHATNETVVEMVAHSNKITPTEVAYFLLQKFTEAYNRLHEAKLLLFENTQEQINKKNKSINRLAERTSARAGGIVAGQHNNLNIVEITLTKELKTRLFRQHSLLSNQQEKIIRLGKTVLLSKKEKLRMHQQSLSKSSPRNIDFNAKKIELLSEKVKLLDPKNILKRGFSITTFNGKSIKNATQLSVGNEIETIYHTGKTTSTIKKTQP